MFGSSPLSRCRTGNYYLYSFDGRLLARYDVYGFCQSEYIYMGNRLIAERDHVGNRTLYYTSDQINSTRIVTNDSGTVVHAQAYDPYGGIQLTWVSSFDPMPKFSGKEHDEESGLDYFGARYYDRSIYRFISVDPQIDKGLAAADPQSSALYVYCRNNPLRYYDPNGRSWIEFNAVQGVINVFSGKGQLLASYPASNLGLDSRGNPNPFPEGRWTFAAFQGPGDYWPGISMNGIITFNVSGHPGMGIHAYEENPFWSWCSWYGRDYTSSTAGCIRIPDSGMLFLSGLMHSPDPIRYIRVLRPYPIVPDCMVFGFPIEIAIITPLPSARDLSWVLSQAK